MFLYCLFGSKGKEKMAIIDYELLKSGAAAFGVEADQTALERFDCYANMIIETNKVMNLTSITEPADIVNKHFLDSLTVLAAVNLPKSAKMIDVGTGAGLPGIALLIARPDLALTLLDSTKKKLEFLKTVLIELGLNASTVHARAEEAARKSEFREKYDLATARAVAGMNELSEYCLPFVKMGGKFVAMKGSNAQAELNLAKSAIKSLGGFVRGVKTFQLPGVGERNLLIIEREYPSPYKYPRPSAQIAKKPL
jgi:16S rRNA (guanine527-N7)-methyltransferase